MSELKWKEERKRRLKTEQRLKLAEDALKRLDKVRTTLHVLNTHTYTTKSLHHCYRDIGKEQSWYSAYYSPVPGPFVACIL